MKKHLLSTSAIALGVAMASPAAAQEWDLEWGGFSNTHIGASDVDLPSGDDRDFDGVNVYTNAEIIFSPNVTLDNGLTFGITVEYEALNGGGGQDGIDESFAYMESDTLGRIEAGSHNSAGYLLMGSVYTPGVDKIALNSPSISAFIPFAGAQGSFFRQAGISSLTEVAGNNDVQRLTYFTPSFNGLTVGVSYAPDNSTNAGNNAPVNFNSAGRVTDIFDIGVRYQQSFGGVDVGFAARWGTGDRSAGDGTVTLASPDDITFDQAGNITDVDFTVSDAEAGDPTTWAIGGTIGFNAFTFGATYSENDNDNAGGVGDSEGYSLGVSYDLAGPWSIGAETYQGEIKNGAGLPDSDYEAYKIAGTRELGTGVSWTVYYAYVETNDGSDADNPSIDGNVIATSINLSF